MVDNHKVSNANGGGSDFESAVVGPNDKEVNVNGVALDIGTGSWGLGGESLVTYKRRKFAKVTESEKVSDDSVSQPGEKVGSFYIEIHEFINYCSKIHLYFLVYTVEEERNFTLFWFYLSVFSILYCLKFLAVEPLLKQGIVRLGI